jgi:hypothetical protein
MFTEKTYTLVCHGCGRFHEKKAMFLSAPMSYGFPGVNGTTWSIPALGCPECMATPRDANGDGPIGRAWKHGATPEAKARMNAEWPEWRTKLEAAKS